MPMEHRHLLSRKTIGGRPSHQSVQIAWTLCLQMRVYQKDSKGYVAIPKLGLVQEESTPQPESAKSESLICIPPPPYFPRTFRKSGVPPFATKP
jgi:hypothetical protein